MVKFLWRMSGQRSGWPPCTCTPWPVPRICCRVLCCDGRQGRKDYCRVRQAGWPYGDIVVEKGRGEAPVPKEGYCTVGRHCVRHEVWRRARLMMNAMGWRLPVLPASCLLCQPSLIVGERRGKNARQALGLSAFPRRAAHFEAKVSRYGTPYSPRWQKSTTISSRQYFAAGARPGTMAPSAWPSGLARWGDPCVCERPPAAHDSRSTFKPCLSSLQRPQSSS